MAAHEYTSELYRQASRIALHELGQREERAARGDNPLYGRHSGGVPDAMSGSNRTLASEKPEDIAAAIDALAAAAASSHYNHRR